MIATLLLTHSEFKTSAQSTLVDLFDSSAKAITKIMPQTLLSISLVAIKIMNNIMRIDLKFA